MLIKKICAAVAAAAIGAAMSVAAFAYTYSPNDATSLKEHLLHAESGETVNAVANIRLFENCGIGEGITLSAQTSLGRGVVLCGEAVLENDGIIEEGAVCFESGASATLINRGELGISTIEAGSTVHNYGKISTRYGITLKGTLILEKGSKKIEIKPVLDVRDENYIEMKSGATIKNNSYHTVNARLEDNTTVRILSGESFTAQKTAAPVIEAEEADGNFRRITITCATEGAQIYYTINGDAPTKASMPYYAPVNVPRGATIKAVAHKAQGITSSIAYLTSVTEASTSADFISFGTSAPQDITVAAPSASPKAGNYSVGQTVKLSCSTPGATIYYTIDGTEPDTSSAKYFAPFDIAESTVLKAKAVKLNHADSETMTFGYGIGGYADGSVDYTSTAFLDEFWAPSVEKINQAAANSTVAVNAKSCPNLSLKMMKALAQRESVSLIITRQGGGDITIPADKALDDYDGRVRMWYSLEYLAALFA